MQLSHFSNLNFLLSNSCLPCESLKQPLFAIAFMSAESSVLQLLASMTKLIAAAQQSICSGLAINFAGDADPNLSDVADVRPAAASVVSQSLHLFLQL